MVISNLQNKKLLLSNFSIKWGWFMALGIVLVILGLVAATYVFATSVVAAIYIGILMIFAGVAQIFQAFNVKAWSQFFLWLTAGVVYLLAGFVCFYNPLEAIVILTFVLGFFLVLSGVLRIAVGFQSKGVVGSSWIITSGVLSVLLGVVILCDWPVGSFYFIGIFVAVDLIFQGWSCIAFSLGLKALQD